MEDGVMPPAGNRFSGISIVNLLITLVPDAFGSSASSVLVIDSDRLIPVTDKGLMRDGPPKKSLKNDSTIMANRYQVET
jgi:hypothetical protein